MGIVVLSIVEGSMNKIALCIIVVVDELTAKRAIIASNVFAVFKMSVTSKLKEEQL